MYVEQAVFTSGKTRHGQGYHVVARSPGISSDMLIAMNRWCPSHASLSLTSMHAESLNFHPLSGNSVAISRTVFGGKEFSSRGGLQVATMVLAVEIEQLHGYDYNPFRFARVARSMGHLRWHPTFPERLERLKLPRQEWSESQLERTLELDVSLEPVMKNVRSGNPTALVAPQSGIEIAEAIIERLPEQKRVSCSFTTGLKWSKQRPFLLQLLPSVDERTRMRIQLTRTDVLTMADLRQPTSLGQFAAN